jgi:hypothetical protein
MLTPIDTHLTLVVGPDPLEIVLENTGQTKIADFERWDVIVQYYDSDGFYQVKYLTYSASGGGINQWGVGWIKLNDEAEKFEPNVLNPGEQLMIETSLDPSVSDNATNMVVISTPSGITCSTYFAP